MKTAQKYSALFVQNFTSFFVDFSQKNSSFFVHIDNPQKFLMQIIQKTTPKLPSGL